MVDTRADSIDGRPSVAAPRLDYVRPGPNALTWLESTVADLKNGDPFRPVAVVVPNDYAGSFARWHLGRRDGYVNVTTMRLRQIVRIVAGPPQRGRFGPIHPVVEASAARAALRQVAELKDFRQASVVQALVEFFRELRRTEVDLNEVRRGGPTAQAALVAFEQFRQRTGRYDDPTTVANAATARLRNVAMPPAELAALGALILYLPTRLDPAEARFLAAAARWIPLVAGFIDAEDPPGDGARDPDPSDADRLARALGVEPPRPERSGDRLPSGTIGRIVRAPDPAEEVREVIRHVVAEIDRVPLHRVGILYRQSDPYARLVRDALNAAGLPWVSSEGHRLSETRAGRALSGLLRLPERGFTRTAVLDWLETLPPLDGPVGMIPPASWDRLSRAANVSRGAEQWSRRLAQHAVDLDAETKARESDGVADSALEGRRRQARDARRIADAVASLDRDLRPPADGSTWVYFAAWATRLRRQYLGAADRWPPTERESLDGLDQILESLRSADRFSDDAGPDLSEFLAEFEVGLSSRRLPTGRLGTGVLVEPITAVAGLSFDRVYLLGAVAGAYPTSPPSDPFFPPGGRDPLHQRTRHRAKERRDFLVALASADGGTVTLMVPDSDGQRAATPSRWLLAFAEQLEYGNPSLDPSTSHASIDTAGFRALDPTGRGWLRVIASAQHGVTSAVAPADLEDRRLADAANWQQNGLALALHPLGRRSDLPLGPALNLAERRRSRDFTPYDGNVTVAAGQSRRIAQAIGGRRPISATAIQTWATCGFRYFLERVLSVEPTEQPEDVWTIDATDRGKLIHQVLQNFFVELGKHDRPRPDDDFNAGDVALIERLAEEQFREYASRGSTGHPLAWMNAQRAILADLRSFLAADRQWRATHPLRPSFYEQSFGFTREDSWPAAEVRAGDHLIRFHGVIDRIDLSPDRKVGYVFDYKTGSSSAYASLDADPVAAGTHIQIALYSQVVRDRYPTVEQVGGAFWFATNRGEFKRLEMTADAATAGNRLAEVVGIVTRGIQAGSFPQVPGAEDRGSFANCHYCAFDRVCPARRDRAWERKLSDPIAAIATELGVAQSVPAE